MLNSILNYYVIPQTREGLGDDVKTLPTHVRLAVITAIAVGPAAATILTGGPGVLDLVRRNGAGSQSVDEVLILIGLRLSQVQRVDQSSLLLNLGVLSLHLDRNLLVMQLPIVGIVILHDLLGRLIDRSGNRTGVSCHRILDVSLTLTVLTAAVSQLTRDRVGILHLSNTHLRDTVLDAVTSLHDVSVETIHLCKLIIAHAAETVLKTIELVDDGLVVEASLDFSAETAIHAASGNVDNTGLAIAIPVPISASAPAKEGEQDDQNPSAIIVAEPIVVSTIVVSYCCNICQGRGRCKVRTEHRNSSLRNRC